MRALVVAVLTALSLAVPLTASSVASAVAPSAAGCDPIDPTACLLPFPDDWFTVPDASTGTGRRIDFSAAEMPRNSLGVAADPTSWNGNDGFSPGSMLLTDVPGIDLVRSGAAPITDIGASLRPDAPIAIIDTRTGQRWPYWAELDANATEPARQALIVRPARNFLEGHHYVVALRNLRDSGGHAIAANSAFRKVAGPALPSRDRLRARQRAERPVLADLARHGIGPKGLYLAWDFTVASEQNLAGRVLTMRDGAFGKLGRKSPPFVVTKSTDMTGAIARQVNGFVIVPSYLDQYGGPPGSSMHYGPNGLPAQLPGNYQWAPFQCEIPRAAFTAPAHASLYGHGLLGNESEVGDGPVTAMAAEHDFVLCATKWIGLSDEDIVNAVGALADIGRFHTVADRLQQSMLNFMFLGRAMTTGFSSSGAFQNPQGKPVIDARDGLAYDGNSQGGIMGGALTAVSTDVRRAVLGVPGLNYSTLLNRSSDFATYAKVLDVSYPDKLDQQMSLALIQMLWDRGEADGYAQHLVTDPYPGTPGHQVLMHVAFGDHQVANVTSDVEARTIGARLRAPALSPGRSLDTAPLWGIPTISGFPYTGSAMVVWDSGSPPAPLTNTPPTTGHDPHEDPRNSVIARDQMAVFLSTGQVVDVCGTGPCVISPA